MSEQSDKCLRIKVRIDFGAMEPDELEELARLLLPYIKDGLGAGDVDASQR